MLFRLKGVHVPHRKHTADMPAVRMPAPAAVTIPMSMHIGAPATPTVAVGDYVYVGQKIAEAGGFVSAPIHSSVSGTVKSMTEILTSAGRKTPAIVIESDGENTPYPELSPPVCETKEDLAKALRECGLVGLGGAGFPTSVKFATGDKPYDTILLNGAECEPYITSDTRTMIDRANDIAEGVALLKRIMKPERIVLGIEKNKPQCIEKMTEALGADAEVMALPSLYPQGGEKVLIYHTTGRVVPEGGLPLDVGVIVINVTTLAVLAEYIRTGMPLVEKCITVDGGAVAKSQNVIVPIGASMHDVFDFCGGFVCEPAKVLYGGPMMGVAVYDLSAPVMKNTNAILALTDSEVKVPKTTACIRCGECLNHCPLKLDPRAFAHAYKLGDDETLKKLKVNLCMECGCCSYICPAKRPLSESNRLAKARLNEYLKKQKEGQAK